MGVHSKKGVILIAVPYINNEESQSDNRFYLFIRELYRTTTREGETIPSPTSEQELREDIYWHDPPPKEQVNEIYQYLSQYHLYLEYNYTIVKINHLYVSDHPLRSRGVFKCKYAKDFGSIMDFLDAYYGLKQNPATKSRFWKQYHKFSRVACYFPGGLAENLIQLSRELLHRYHAQETPDNHKRDIYCYDIDFELDEINTILHS